MMKINELKKEVLADTMQGMTAEQSQILRAKIDKMYADYVKQNGHEPQQAECLIRFLDKDANCECMTIQLSSDTSPDIEDNIFYYCNSLNDLKSLTIVGMNDFIVLDCIILS